MADNSVFKEKLKQKIYDYFHPEEKDDKDKPLSKRFYEFIKQLFYAGLAAFFIITFIIQNTRIPTGSMEDTILVGDFVIVNKFIYGSSSPRYIPFTEIALPYFTLPAIKDPKPGDIVVFEYPGDRDQLEPFEKGVNYVKRCIGLPGDTVEIIDKVVFVNGKEFWRPPYIKYYRGFYNAGLKPLPKGFPEPRIFPKGKPWNEDNYGPLVVPKKGMTINLDINNVEEWRTVIDREFGDRVVEIRGSDVYINNEKVTSYTFKKDYYFMMGDNRDDSLDSRFWGFVSRDAVIGEAFLVLFSWDRNIPFSDLFRLLGSIRTDRILKLIH